MSRPHSLLNFIASLPRFLVPTSLSGCGAVYKNFRSHSLIRKVRVEKSGTLKHKQKDGLWLVTELASQTIHILADFCIYR